jgi:hypothetical protein
MAFEHLRLTMIARHESDPPRISKIRRVDLPQIARPSAAVKQFEASGR